MLFRSVILGAVPYEYLATNGHTYLKNLYTTKGILNIDVTDNGDYLTLKLTAPDTLSSNIRIPEYFHAKAVTKGVKKTGEGTFELRKPLKELEFRLYR